MKKGDMFSTNPQKASSRITINSFMMGSLFFILTLIISTDPYKFKSIVIIELVLAIPLLYISSLAYSKIGYHQNVKLWDDLGWFTNNLGNLFVLNVVGLITATFFKNLALTYFTLIILLFLVYSLINFYYNPTQKGQKLFKFLFLVAIILFGGILPIFL